MIDLEKQKKNFRNHIATLTDYGNVKILDFKNPESSNYRIRFLFEEDFYRLHISGDLGELIATNYKNMCYEGFEDFVHNTGYFEEKIDCHSRRIYEFDEDKAREELKEMAYDNSWLLIADDYDYLDTEEERIDSIIDDILDNFSESEGISQSGYEKLEEFEDDAWEFAYDLGKETTGILGLYMLAFEMAQEQLKEKGAENDY